MSGRAPVAFRTSTIARCCLIVNPPLWPRLHSSPFTLRSSPVISIHISTSDLATPVLRRLASGLQPARLAPVAGRAGRNAVREHLFARDATANRLGGRRTHYYGQAARSTHFTVEGNSVVIAVTQIGIRQRFYGGVIKPKKAKLLTVPVHPAAHGKTAREFDLEIVFGPGGLPIALATKSTRAVSITQTKSGRIVKRSIGRFGEIMFLLLPYVTQKEDKTTLPSMPALAAAIRPELDKYIATLTARTQGAAN